MPVTWGSAVVVLVIVVTVLALPIGGLAEGRLADALFDFAHFPLFAIAAGVVLRAGGRQGWGALVVLLLVAIAMEAVQPLLGRSASVADALTGAAGMAAALCIRQAAGHGAGSKRWTWRLSAAALLAAALFPTATVARDRLDASRSFPLLADFETRPELGRWSTADCRLTLASDHASHGVRAGRLDFVSGDSTYKGMFLIDITRGWDAMQSLCLDVFWPGGEPRTLWLRIDDRRRNPPYGDRFQKSVELSPGANRICIDRTELVTLGGRSLDLERVTRFGLFLTDVEGQSLFVDDVRLMLKGE